MSELATIIASLNLNEHAKADVDDTNLHYPKGFLAGLGGTFAFKDNSGNIEWRQSGKVESVIDEVDGLLAPPTENNGDVFILDKASVILDVDTIVFQSGNTVRITFNGAPDLSGLVINDHARIRLAGNASNNGTFIITLINDGSDFIEVTNPNRSDGTDDEASDSPATTTTTHRDWDEVGDTDHVKFFSQFGKWFGVEPVVGTLAFNKVSASERIFKTTGWEALAGAGVDLSEIRIGNTTFGSDYAAAKTAANVGDTIVIPYGQVLDINDIFKIGVRIHLDGEINYTGSGTANKSILDVQTTDEVLLSGSGTIINSKVGGDANERSVFNINNGDSGGILKFNKALSINGNCLTSDSRPFLVIGNLESNGGYAIGVGNREIAFFGTARSTAGNAYFSGGSFGKITGAGELISTSTIAFNAASSRNENIFTGFIKGLTTAIQLTGACPVVVNGSIEGGIINSGGELNEDFSILIINGHISQPAGGKVTITQSGAGRTVLNGTINNPIINCSDGDLTINSDMYHTGFGSGGKVFNVTGGKCVFNGRYNNLEGTTSTVSGGELHINGELIYGTVAASIAIILSGTGKLVVRGRILQLWNDAVAHVISILGTTANLILNGAELITTHASAKDIFTDSGAGNTDVHIQVTAVTNVTVADTGIAEKVGTITRSADVI